MKKSLIALAVAGAFAAPAFAATSNVDVYGVLNITVEDTNFTGVTPSVLDNTSRIGFKGSEDLGGGLKAIWQIESALGGNGAPISGTTWATRNTFVGLSGGFGTVLMGNHDTPYKLGTASLDIFADTIADYNLGRLGNVSANGATANAGVQLLSNAHDARNNQALAYISPTWSGFHFAAAVVMNNNAGASDKTDDAISLTGVYVNGPLFASLSYQDLGDAAGTNLTNHATKAGIGYTFGDTKVGFVYETVDTGAAATDRDSWLLNVAHTMGPMVLKAQYGQADVGTAGQDAWALGVDYNLSKRTAAYVVFGSGDTDTAAGSASGWNIGIKHSF